jgi:two-component system, response regulator, stage 0 sporulation protein F
VANSEHKKILYVDDEDINLQLFKLTFQKKYEILLAESAKKGLKIFENTSNINLIISDMRMPAIDGLEFIDMVKEKNKDIPCLILSGYEMTDRIQEAIHAKTIVDYMMKPFQKDKLENLMQRAMGLIRNEDISI